MLCVTPHGEREHKEVCTWIPPNSACDFPPYYIFTILSHEYGYMLSPISPSSQPTNVKSGLRDSIQRSYGVSGSQTSGCIRITKGT